jgi:erythrocyte band 7 integral membrane protein
MKDVRLPVQLQRAMAAEAEASRDARAKVIAAKGEKNASQALSDAAVTLHKSPIAIQLRFLQTLNSISSEKNRTIIFPFPIEIIKNLINKPK